MCRDRLITTRAAVPPTSPLQMLVILVLLFGLVACSATPAQVGEDPIGGTPSPTDPMPDPDDPIPSDPIDPTDPTDPTDPIPPPPTDLPLAAAPTLLSFTPRHTGGDLAFTPGDDGGQPITNYDVSFDGGDTWSALSPSQTLSPLIIRGLVDGTTYELVAAAVTAAGRGAPSISVRIEPHPQPIDVDAGAFHTVALNDDGTLSTWGWNSFGQLGHGYRSDTPVTQPTLVADFPPEGSSIIAVAAGAAFTVALLDDGALYTWGYNEHGQLGHGHTGIRSTPNRVTTFAPADTSVIGIAAGGRHVVALLSDGTIYTWGDGGNGQLGHDSKAVELSPRRVSDFPSQGRRIVAIAAGGAHSVALLDDGALYTWGRNAGGQLGLGDFEERLTPTLVPSSPFGGAPLTSIAAGANHTAALLSDGDLYTWGLNDRGQLGHAVPSNRHTPTRVESIPLEGTSVEAITLGGEHSLALVSTPSLYSWGYNFYGELGHDDTAIRLTPTLVAASPSSASLVALAAGQGHTVALLDEGIVYAWGYNFYGQVGDETRENRLSPVRVLGTGVVRIDSGPIPLTRP